MTKDTVQIKKIKYGNIDLTNASNGTQQVNLSDFKNTSLDLNKLKIERSFSKSTSND